MKNLKKSSDQYSKIRAIFELFGFKVVGELTWDKVDAFLLDIVYCQFCESKKTW